MSKRTTHEQDFDRLLQPGSGRFGEIYRRLSRPEPPRRLDRVILANAARAVHGERAPPAQRWMLGIGTAAGVVLAAGIAWQVGRQMESRDQAVHGGAERPRTQMIEVQPITEPAPTLEADDSRAMDAESSVAAEAGTAPAEAPRRKAVRPPPAPAVAPPPAPPAPAAATPLAEPVVAPEHVEAVAPDPEAQAFPPGIPADSAATQDPMHADRKDALTRSSAGKAAALGARAEQRPQAARAPAPTTSVQLRENMRLAPELWLAEIQRLHRAGHRQQAIENLRLFRRMHPDWQLSDELLRLLE